MDITYKIIGGDGKEYGPVGLEELQNWIRTGRVCGETQVWRSDRGAWAAAAQWAELQLAPPPRVSADAAASTTPVVDPAASVATLELERQLKAGAGWFYWIAGLSAINTVAALTGSQWRFMFGLGITQLIDGVAHQSGPLGLGVAVVLDILALGMFVLFGYCAGRRQTWSFLTGLILFALDGLIFLMAGDWLGVGLHVFAWYGVFKGYQASRALTLGGRSAHP